MSKTAFYYSESPYRQTLQGLYKALSGNEALVKFLGAPRLGKSTLCEKLALFMQHKGYRVVYFSYAMESPDMLRAMLARELDVPKSSNFSRTLEDLPLDDDGKPLILLFDDAHQLSPTTLLEIYRLVQVQSGVIRKLNIVLCGEPTLEQTLKRQPELQSLLMHVSHNIVLTAMSKAEQEQFLNSYLAKTGSPAVKLDNTATAYFYKLTGGLPGPALEIAKAIAAAAKNDATLTTLNRSQLAALLNHSRAAAGEYAQVTQLPAASSQWGMLGPVAVVVVVASVVMLYQQVTGGEDSSQTETAVAVSDVADSPFVSVDATDGVDPTVSVVVPSLLVPDASGADVVDPDTAPFEPDNTDPTPAVTDAAVVIETPEPAPVSDSDLVLVTAAERGIAAADIVEPIYTDVANNTIAADELRMADVIEPASNDVVAADNAVVDNSTVVESVADFVASTPTIADVEPSQTLTAAAPATELPAQSTVVPDTDEERVTESVPAYSAPLSAPTVSSDLSATRNDPQADDAASMSVEESARELVQDWISAWQAQDLAGYFASYHDNFEPRYHDSFAIWQRDRTRVISNAASIRLAMRDLTVVSQTPAQTEVQVWLDYSSPTYADSTLKKLVLATQNNRWLILEEINLQVVRP